MKPKYSRVLLKMSGEALSGDTFGIDPKVLDRIAGEIAELRELNVQVGIVLGGGNLFRGAALSEAGLTRISGDYMGMLATIMNAIALRDALVRADIETRVMSSIAMPGITDVFHVRKAIHHLERDRVIIFAGGTGNPFFTTDSAASLRSIEIEADVMLKATKVDGVFSADPEKDSKAKKFDKVSYKQVIEQDLKVMDSTAICLCREHNMPIVVFNMNKPNTLKNIVLGKAEGTVVS